MSKGPEAHKTQRLSTAQRLAWLRLIRSENVGPRTFHDLLQHFGDAEVALENLPALSRRGGKGTIRICPESEAETELAAHKTAGARLIALGEADYPPHLAHIDGPPPLLSIRGSGETLARPKALAVVGARNASLSGRKLAGQFSRELSEDGYVIVSGLARGIDAAAHEAALSGGTVAVFAGGIDRLYPPEHDRLLTALLENGGAAISEMPFGWKPRGRDFPRRNRLISGLSLGVLVIEAAERSGSLHTARFALEQNREIFAVPGSPLDPRSAGANRLIKQGATLITSTQDVLDSLGGRIEPVPPLGSGLFEGEGESLFTGRDGQEPGERTREKILTALGPAPVELDELIRDTGEPARIVHTILLELELAGRLERHRGNRVSLLY
jgi:DNA processing protein